MLSLIRFAMCILSNSQSASSFFYSLINRINVFMFMNSLLSTALFFYPMPANRMAKSFFSLSLAIYTKNNDLNIRKSHYLLFISVCFFYFLVSVWFVPPEVLKLGIISVFLFHCLVGCPFRRYNLMTKGPPPQ